MDGSPPRVWGILLILGIQSVAVRFTPTDVGNTVIPCNYSRYWSVHPHWRGEYPLTTQDIDIRIGSSPLTWGIQRLGCRIMEQLRFTPTCVGNTAHISRMVRLRAAHPHWRGEYDECRHTRSRNAVHPHVCGEYSPARTWSTHMGGSPPLAWGIISPYKVPQTEGQNPNPCRCRCRGPVFR